MEKKHEIYVSDRPDVEFTGELLVSVEEGTGGYKLYLYRESQGDFVCHKLSMDSVDNGQSQSVVCLSEDIGGVYEFFGFTDDAKELYQAANIRKVNCLDRKPVGVFFIACAVCTVASLVGMFTFWGTRAAVTPWMMGVTILCFACTFLCAHKWSAHREKTLTQYRP